MSPLKQYEKERKCMFLFYDFETQQNTPLQGDPKTYVHIPNLCVVQQVCTRCFTDEDMSNICSECGVREYVFDKDPVKEFVELATRKVQNFNKIICIAHNAKSFDAQFILRYLIEEKNLKDTPEILLWRSSSYQSEERSV